MYNPNYYITQNNALTFSSPPQLTGPTTSAVIDPNSTSSNNTISTPQHPISAQSPETPKSDTLVNVTKIQLLQSSEMIQSIGTNIMKNIAYIVAVRETKPNFNIHDHFDIFSSHLLDAFQGLISLLRVCLFLFIIYSFYLFLLFLLFFK